MVKDPHSGRMAAAAKALGDAARELNALVRDLATSERGADRDGSGPRDTAVTRKYAEVPLFAEEVADLYLRVETLQLDLALEPRPEPAPQPSS